MVLPNFLIAGAEKAGTTAFDGYLRQHPDVFMSRPKETFFFSGENYAKGIEWFASHFEEHGGERAVGEATARTMSIPEAPERIHRHVSNVRLIFILRNPIERAYSHYYYHVYKGKQEANYDFDQLIRDETHAFRNTMIDRGKYDLHLSRFGEYFDEEQMKVMLYRNFRNDTEKILKDTFTFLGVDRSFGVDTSPKRNVTRYPDSLTLYYWIRRLWHTVRDPVESRFPDVTDALRQGVRKTLFSKERPSMSRSARAYLRDIYAEPNARLEERLGRDLSHWK